MLRSQPPSAPRPREQAPRALLALLGDLVRRPWGGVRASHFLVEYAASERLPPDLLRARQQAALRRIAWHCFLEVPRLRERIGARLRPAELERLEEIALLPIGAAEERRRDPDAFVAAGAAVAARRSTAGMRGAPQPVRLDAESLARQEAVRRRAEAWAGAPPLELVSAWGRDVLRPPAPLDRSERERLAKILRSGARPVVSAPAGSFDAIGALIERRRGPAALIARGPDAGDRAGALARETGAPLHRFYGAAEVGLIASHCERGGLHVHADHLILEAVDERGLPSPPGASGRLLVTDLHNRAAPYLRHELSDRGRLPGRGCACGRALPLLELDLAT